MSGSPSRVSFLNTGGRPLELGLGRRLEHDPAALGRVLVLCGDAERAAALNAGLWTFDPASFIPHGGPGDGAAEDHPIWIDKAEAAEDFQTVVIVDDAVPADWAAYQRHMYLFDAHDPEARDRARGRWREWADAGAALAYWTLDGGEWRLERRT